MKKVVLSIAMFAITIGANAQNCIEILPGTVFSPSSTPGKFKLTINYATDGNKTLETIIKCGTDTILVDCFSVRGDSTKVYDNLTCGSQSQLTATFIRRTGSCSSAKCGPDVLLGNNVLASKISKPTVIRNKNVFTIYFDVLEDINTYQYNIKLSTDGINFKTRAIIFPDQTKAGKYQVTIKL